MNHDEDRLADGFDIVIADGGARHTRGDAGPQFVETSHAGVLAGGTNEFDRFRQAEGYDVVVRVLKAELNVPDQGAPKHFERRKALGCDLLQSLAQLIEDL